jgi:hypothetical protein
VPDIQALFIEMDGGNDPEFIAPDIENVIRADTIDGVESRLHLSEILE